MPTADDNAARPVPQWPLAPARREDRAPLLPRRRQPRRSQRALQKHTPGTLGQIGRGRGSVEHRNDIGSQRTELALPGAQRRALFVLRCRSPCLLRFAYPIGGRDASSQQWPDEQVRGGGLSAEPVGIDTDVRFGRQQNRAHPKVTERDIDHGHATVGQDRPAGVPQPSRVIGMFHPGSGKQLLDGGPDRGGPCTFAPDVKVFGTPVMFPLRRRAHGALPGPTAVTQNAGQRGNDLSPLASGPQVSHHEPHTRAGRHAGAFSAVEPE